MRQRICRRKTVALIIVAVLAGSGMATYLLVAPRIADFSFAALLRSVGIVREDEQRSARVLLQEMKRIYAMDTVEMVYDIVFPYDFMDNRLDIQDIITAVRSGTGSVGELLDPVQELYLRAYNLAHDLGMATGPDQFDFVVTTVVVRAGIVISDPVLVDPGNASATGLAQWVSMEPGRNRRVEVRIPPAEITQITIEDPHTGTYPYPDVRIPPEGWKRIALFVREHVRKRVEGTDLLIRASKRVEDLVRGLLSQSGFDTITVVH